MAHLAWAQSCNFCSAFKTVGSLPRPWCCIDRCHGMAFTPGDPSLHPCTCGPAHELAAPTKPRQLVCAGNHAPALMQQLAKFKQVAPAEAWCSPPATLGLDGSHLRYDLLAAVSACPMCASTSQLIVGATGLIA